MLKGLVIGTATATIKHPSMDGCKILIVQPRLRDGRKVDGGPLLVIDPVGAGCGETVMISSDGRGAREMLQVDATPIRWMVIGIRDEV